MRQRILVVDDEERILEMWRDYFESNLDLEVIPLKWPETILDMVEKYQPAAVITDTNMPKLNGVQLLERVKSARPDLPVIVLFSGLGGSTITADDIMARGAHLVLSKTDALVHVLQNLIDLLKIDS